eukprot:TRINITY_DN15623_c0_g2_i1.p1 TRINITY_DN15623_c0_g2~~TRINITY_DN15623_c0_g2_i1.p1  ORF type:complete len:372 (+),score=34.41 TRINITY_DN15623_c0_g2_i1:186-1301(+)
MPLLLSSRRWSERRRRWQTLSLRQPLHHLRLRLLLLRRTLRRERRWRRRRYWQRRCPLTSLAPAVASNLAWGRGQRKSIVPSECNVRPDDMLNRIAPDITKFLAPSELMAFEATSSFMNKCASLSWPLQQEYHFPGLVVDSGHAGKRHFYSTRKLVTTFPGRKLEPSIHWKGKLKVENAFSERETVKLAFEVSTKMRGHGLYFEVFVGSTADVFVVLKSNVEKNLIAFNVATGEVIQAKKITKALPCFPFEKKLDGDVLRCHCFVGVYVWNGNVAFSRRSESREECTGLFQAFHQLDGERVAPHLVLRRPPTGTKRKCAFHAFINEVSAAPPTQFVHGSKLRANRWLSYRFWNKFITRQLVRFLEWRGVHL